MTPTLGGMLMLVVTMGTYVALNLIARWMERKAKKEWLERNSSGPFDLDH